MRRTGAIAAVLLALGFAPAASALPAVGLVTIGQPADGVVTNGPTDVVYRGLVGDERLTVTWNGPVVTFKDGGGGRILVDPNRLGLADFRCSGVLTSTVTCAFNYTHPPVWHSVSVFGGPGNDAITVVSTWDAVRVSGDDGNDALVDSSPLSHFIGGGNLNGGNGSDLLIGSDAPVGDTLDGGPGADRMYGRAGDDVLYDGDPVGALWSDWLDCGLGDRDVANAWPNDRATGCEVRRPGRVVQLP